MPDCSPLTVPPHQWTPGLPYLAVSRLHSLLCQGAAPAGSPTVVWRRWLVTSRSTQAQVKWKYSLKHLQVQNKNPGISIIWNTLVESRQTQSHGFVIYKPLRCNNARIFIISSMSASSLFIRKLKVGGGTHDVFILLLVPTEMAMGSQ